jgi:hypothetical protein
VGLGREDTQQAVCPRGVPEPAEAVDRPGDPGGVLLVEGDQEIP